MCVYNHLKKKLLFYKMKVTSLLPQLIKIIFTRFKHKENL